MPWIGFDDTDDLKGGCTTDLVDRWIRSAMDKGVLTRLLDSRLVRLWPMAPQKTRGNAAISLHFNTCKTLEEVFIHAVGFIKTEAKKWNRNSNPGVVVSPHQFPATLYSKAVSSTVKLDAILKEIKKMNAYFFSLGNENGLIGAVASISWPGVWDWSWEIISYRDVISSPREAIIPLIPPLDPDHIWNEAHLGHKSPAIPNTPCPILFGLRTRQYHKAIHVLLTCQEQKIGDRIRLYRTNQGTGDHITEILEGIVRGKIILKGGHVKLEINTNGDFETWMAFKPAGDVCRLASQVEIGDKVEAIGLYSSDYSLHLEGLRVSRMTLTPSKCECGGSFSSMGKKQGKRCKKCRKRLQLSEFHTSFSQWSKWFRPGPRERRHLSRIGNPPTLTLKR